MEGGWPKEVDSRQRDQVSRFIKKVEKCEDYLEAAIRISGLLEENVRQNNALQIYEDYFSTEDHVTNPETAAVKTLISFPDLWRRPGDPARPVSGTSFSQEGERLAISYSSHNLLEALTWTLPTQGCVFSLTDPTRCRARLSSESAITRVQFSRQGESVLAGGCYSGQVTAGRVWRC